MPDGSMFGAVSQFFWLIFLFILFQPVLKQRLLESSRQRLIARIEAKRKSRVILLVHRQETMSLLGFPVVRYIDIQDSEQILRAIHLSGPDTPIDLVLHTPGGLVLASLQIAHAIHNHKSKVTVFVPHYAMSGGTLIALAAKEIVMCDDAVLGPIDPQIGKYPAASLLRLLEMKPLEKIDDETLIMADQAEKAMSQIKQSTKTFLLANDSPEKAEELAELLTQGAWTHDHPIMTETAKALGLPVTTDMPPEMMQLMSYYPQPVRRQGSVEYLPPSRRNGNDGKSA